MINEEKLYKIIGNFFNDSSNLMDELLQNCQRAGAKDVLIATTSDAMSNIIMTQEEHELCCGRTGQTIYVRDNGHGIRDIKKLLGICYSDWKEERVDEQNPAGMGFLQLIANAEKVLIRSNFGEIIIDCKKFLQNTKYRNELINSIDESEYKEGNINTVIMAILDYKLMYKINDQLKIARLSSYECFDKLVINDVKVCSVGIHQLKEWLSKGSGVLKTYSYKGNELLMYLGPKYQDKVSDLFPEGHYEIYFNQVVNWYGHLLGQGYSYSFVHNFGVMESMIFFYDVKRGTPLNLQFPDRRCIIKDDLYDEFTEFIKKKTCEIIEEFYTTRTQKQTECFSGWDQMRHIRYIISHDPIRAMNVPYCCPESDLENAIFCKSSSSSMILHDDVFNQPNICFNDSSKNDTKTLTLDHQFELTSILCESPIPMKIYDVDKATAQMLRKKGFREFKELKILETGANSGILGGDVLCRHSPLPFLVTFTDNSKFHFKVKEGIIISNDSDILIIAPTPEKVSSLWYSYTEDMTAAMNYSEVSEFEERFEDYFKEMQQSKLFIIDKDAFDFLDDYITITNIKFNNSILTVTYKSGNTRDYTLV